MLISHLEHGVHNVLAQTEWHPHDQGIKKSSPLQYELTLTIYGP
jgi:hypothetical protein